MCSSFVCTYGTQCIFHQLLYSSSHFGWLCKKLLIVVIDLVATDLWRVAAGKSDTDKPTAAADTGPAASSEPVIINAKSYQSRLGLARVLTRQSADFNEIKKLYIEAIDMAPNVS